MGKIIKKVTLNAPASTSTTSTPSASSGQTGSGQTGADPTKGTQTNPYTLVEMASLQEVGTWNGGYVAGMGYVPSTVIVSGTPDLSYYIYLYSLFEPIDKIYHHTFVNPGESEGTELTDIHVKADIKGYIITIKVSITIKDINTTSGIHLDYDFTGDIKILKLEDGNGSPDSDGKYNYQFVLKLPEIIPPTIKLTIKCGYLHDNYPYNLTKEIIILSPYDCYA